MSPTIENKTKRSFFKRKNSDNNIKQDPQAKDLIMILK